MAQTTVDTTETKVDLDEAIDGMAQLCSDKDLGEPAVVLEYFDELVLPPSSRARRVTGTVANLSIGGVVVT